jgi:hypothetical protein
VRGHNEPAEQSFNSGGGQRRPLIYVTTDVVAEAPYYVLGLAVLGSGRAVDELVWMLHEYMLRNSPVPSCFYVTRADEGHARQCLVDLMCSGLRKARGIAMAQREFPLFLAARKLLLAPKHAHVFNSHRSHLTCVYLLSTRA